jgi:hypothetical protein
VCEGRTQTFCAVLALGAWRRAAAAGIAIVKKQWACAGALCGGLAPRGSAGKLSRVADDAVSLVAAGTSARPTHQNTYPTFASLPMHFPSTTTT